MRPALSNNSTVFILLGIGLLLMPVGALLDGATQWIVIIGSIVLLFLCAYNLRKNNRRSGA
jgi:uncharacterized membrane protein